MESKVGKKLGGGGGVAAVGNKDKVGKGRGDDMHSEEWQIKKTTTQKEELKYTGSASRPLNKRPEALVQPLLVACMPFKVQPLIVSACHLILAR